MPVRSLVIAAIILVMTGLGLPRPVAALECIPLADIVAKMDEIVQGRITAIPSNGVLELAVSRYYKGGSGSAQLRAEVTGLGQGQRMDWNSIPKVGDELIIGFVQRGDALVNEACNLFVQLDGGHEPPQEIKNYLGEGRTPVGGAESQPLQESMAPALDREDQARTGLVWILGGGLMVIGLASWIIWRWRRNLGPKE